MSSTSRVTTIILLTLALLFTTTTFAAPLPSSSVELHLNNGRTSRCTLHNAPTRATADVVTSKLVATGKIACPGSTDHPSGGKITKCESGQLAAPEEANEVLKQTCADHLGLHEML